MLILLLSLVNKNKRNFSLKDKCLTDSVLFELGLAPFAHRIPVSRRHEQLSLRGDCPVRTHRQSCCSCHYLPSSPLETKVSGAGWADPHSKKEMFNVRTLGPFFLEKESRVPSPLLVFHPEFAQKKAGARHGHPGFRQDPCRWSSLALPLPLSPPSWTPQCQRLSQDGSRVPLVPPALHLSPEGGRQEAPTATVWFLGSLNSSPDGPPVLCANWMDESRPALQVEAREPVNRAILRTIALYCSNQYAQYMLNVY